MVSVWVPIPEWDCIRWMEQAQNSLAAAQRLFSCPFQSFNARVCFLSHEVVEHSLKAALICAKCGLFYYQLHSHNVVSLAKDVCKLRGSPAELINMASVFKNYYLATRFPNQHQRPIVPAHAFGTEEAEEALEIARILNGTVNNLIGLFDILKRRQEWP